MRHVGRPSNKELKIRKIKKSLMVLLPIIAIVVVVIVVANSDNLSKLMGNSVIEYYCEDSTYTLEGTNCKKIIKEKANVIGDANLDGMIDVNDVTKLQFMITNEEFNVIADINEDGIIDESDINILQSFLVGDYLVSTTGITYDYIGEKKVCASDYTLNGDYCEKTDVVKALVKTTQQTNEFDNPVDITITDDQKGNTNITSGSKVNLNIVFKINDTSKKYYYMEKLTVDNVDSNKSACLEVKNQTINQTLELSKGSEAEKTFTIYSDAGCHVVVKRFTTNSYKINSTTNEKGNEETESTTTDNTFTIKYNASGGSGTMSDQKITYGTTTALTKNKFTKSGYAFTGWKAYNTSKQQYACYKSSDKKSQGYADTETCKKYGYVIYKDGQNVSKTGTPGETITFYAQWTNEFTIKYNASGGSGTMSDQKIAYGTTTALTTNEFTKSGYGFSGWKAYNTSKQQYACYKSSDKKTQGYADTAICKKYGYVIYKDGQNVSKTGTPGETITFYAQWTNQFTIKYNANGGKGSMSNQKITYDKTTALTKNKFTKSNYYFNGWRVYSDTKKQWVCYLNSSKTKQGYTDAATCKKYGYVIYRNGQNVARTAKPGETVTFYAQWIYNYKSGIQAFNGFEKDPVGATVWPMKNLTIYKNSNGTSSTNQTVSQGAALKVLDITNKTNLNNSYIKIKYNGTTGWVDSKYVMINLPDVIPSIIYSIRNADSSIFKNNNKSLSGVTGQNLYGSTWYSYNKRIGRNEYLAPIRVSTAKKIQRAQSTALKYGNKLKIYDLYRPWNVQLKVKQALDKVSFTGASYCIPNEFDIKYSSNGTSVSCITDSKGWFIAQNASSHNLAKAIDVTLVTSDDNSEIKMQSNMHELSRLSVPTNSTLKSYPAEISLNKLFIGVDFKFLLSEWWHFEDTDARITQAESKSLSNKTLKLAS